jgi:hypothetical protein
MSRNKQGREAKKPKQPKPSPKTLESLTPKGTRPTGS